MEIKRLITLLNEINQDSEVVLRSHSGELSTVANISMEERNFVNWKSNEPSVVINAGSLIQRGYEKITVSMPHESFWQRNYAIPWVISIISLSAALAAIAKLLMM